MARRKSGQTPPATESAPAAPDNSPELVETSADIPEQNPAAEPDIAASVDATSTEATEPAAPADAGPDDTATETTLEHVDESAPSPIEETDATPVPSPAIAPARSGTSMTAMLLSGLTGGVAAAVIAGGAWVYGVLPLPLTKNALPTAQQTQPADDQALPKRLADAEAAIRDISTRLGAAEKLLSAKLAAPISKDPAPPAGSGTTTTGLQVTTTKPEANPDDRTKAESVEVPIAGLKADQAEAAKRLATLEAALKAPRLTPQDIAPLAERTARLEAELGKAKAALSDVAMQAKSAAVDPRSAAAVAILTLRARLDRGAPFVPELASAKALIKDPARLVPLDSFAAEGLPTAATLRERFAAQAPKLQQSAAPAPDKSLLERLGESARRLVRLRPVGEAGGDDAGAIIARMEARLAKGDLASALAEFAKLPPATRKEAEGWSKLVEARIAADRLTSDLAAETVAALAATAAQPQR